MTNRTETPSESLITVSLPPKLHSEVVAFQHRTGLSTLSEAIRLRELILFGNPLQDAPVCALHADTGPLFKFLADATFQCSSLGTT